MINPAKYDHHFLNMWRRDFLSACTTLHALLRNHNETRYRTDPIDWEAACIEAALKELRKPAPERELQKRGPKPVDLIDSLEDEE